MLDNILEIHGLLIEEEVKLLMHCAHTAPPVGAIVELGTFQGRGTAALCAVVDNDRVVTIDNWCMHHYGPNEAGITERNLAALGFSPRIISGQSHVVPDDIKSVAMLFIDTEHRAVVLNRELDAWLPLVRRGGIVAMHDYDNPGWPTMKPAIDGRFTPNEWESLGLERWLIAFRRLSCPT